MNYLAWREQEIDHSEWADILSGLRILGAKKSSKIYEVGAGSGGLVRYLRRHGYIVEGCDLRGDGRLIAKCDLNKEVPPPSDYYVFQHVIEHLEEDTQKNLLAYMVKQSKGVVGILPGHYNEDPTHVTNHYDYNDIVSIITEIERETGKIYYIITPDSRSFIAPRWRDWVLIMSRNPFNFSARRFYGLLFYYSTRITKILVEMKWRMA